MPNERSLTSVPKHPSKPALPERIYHEINLMRVEGYYFCLDPKGAVERTGKGEFVETIRSFGEIIEKPVIIVPDPRYGWPGVLAYKLTQALIRKASRYGYPIPGSVTLSNREISRLIGRTSFGGAYAPDFFNAVMQLNSTQVWCSIFDKDTKEWEALGFKFIHTIKAKLTRTKTGYSLKNATFFFAPEIIESLNKRYAVTLNYARFGQLKPVGMALYKRLFYHFSNVYSQKKSRDFSFRKDYTAICTTWLGGLKLRKYKAHIRQQLGAHLDGLVQTGLIASYGIEKNANETGFNLTFYPGEGFFEDYIRFYGAGFQLAPSFDDQPPTDAGNPGEIVAHFHKKRLGTKRLRSQQFSAGELALARELLEMYSVDEIHAFIDYALEEAEKTNYHPRTFGGIRQYIEAFELEKQRRHRQAEKLAQQQALERKERQEGMLFDRYNAMRRTQIDALRETLSDQEIEELEQRCRETLQQQYGHNSPALEVLVRQELDSVLSKRADVPSFEEWKETIPVQ